MKRTRSHKRLPLMKKISYGLPAFSLAMVGIPVYVHIPKFYTDVIGVDIAWVGAILLVVRMFDAFSDPMMGIFSDRVHTRMGRRRPFILGGSLCLAAAVFLLFVPPELDGRAAVIWFTLTIFAVFLFWTVITVPYEALGPALTTDYTERTSLFAIRDGMLIAGTLFAAASPVLIEALQPSSATDAAQRQKFFWIAGLYAPLLIGTCLWCVMRIREPNKQKDASPAFAFGSLRSILRNRPFLILLTAYTIGAIGSNLPATLILYYVQYVLQSSRADLFLLIYFAAGIVMLPVWIRISEKIGKKKAWLTSMAVNTSAFCGVFFLGAGDEWLALPSAIQADVIDYDEFLTGRRQEGWYIGIWSVVKKLAAAVGVGAGLTLLGLTGYAPGTVQPPEVIQTLKILYALVPSVCNAVAFVIALSFPISQPVHRRILEGIELLKQGRKAVDPLKP